MKKELKKVYLDDVRKESKKYSLHSWSTEDLNQLRDIKNHRIVHDTYNYVWECKMNNKWERRSIQDYIDYKKPYSHLYFWLDIWNKEYVKRVEYVERRRLRDQTKRYSEAVDIINKSYLKRAEVVRRVHELLPEMTKQRLSELTGMSYKQVKRILKEI